MNALLLCCHYFHCKENAFGQCGQLHCLHHKHTGVKLIKKPKPKESPQAQQNSSQKPYIFIMKSSYKVHLLRYFNPVEILLCRFWVGFFFFKYPTGSLYVIQWEFSIATLKLRNRCLSYSKK